MDYFKYDPDRYAPDLKVARQRGAADWRSIADWLGGNRKQRLLEIGCSSGSLLVALREQGFSNCQGVDLDEALVRHGREALKVAIEQSTWYSYLENSQEIYDTIIALDVLEHLPREELLPTLKITRERLAPGGRLILRAPNALCPLALPTLYGDLTHQFLVTPRALTHVLRSVGFAGRIIVKETRPDGALKRLLYTLVHRALIKPFFGLTFYHFHGEFPSHLTPNINVCAYADSVQI